MQNELLERRRRLLGPAYRLFYRDPLHLVRGEGVWLYDSEGNRFLDMYNNVAHVGHCHPRVVEAISNQAATLNTHTRYLHGNILAYSERLLGTFPGELDVVMFACSGSEANELALRIASEVTGATGLIVTDSAYHGTTKATFEISTEDIPADEMPDHVVTVPSPDTYRGEFRDDCDAGPKYAAHLADAIGTLHARGLKPAAFIVDTIVSSGGVVRPPAGYLREAAAVVRDAGGIFVADEVQAGFGRTGQQFWGFEADDVVPDIATMGKPMGNGHPVSAVVTSRSLVERFAERKHYFNTFGGNPVSCAAALAVLDALEEECLQDNAREVGAYLVDGLRGLAEAHEAIGDVRGTGLFIAVELVEDQDTREPAAALTDDIVNGLRDRGVLTGSIGPHRNILKLRPPMVVSRENVDFLLEQLDDALRCRG